MASCLTGCLFHLLHLVNLCRLSVIGFILVNFFLNVTFHLGSQLLAYAFGFFSLDTHALLSLHLHNLTALDIATAQTVDRSECTGTHAIVSSNAAGSFATTHLVILSYHARLIGVVAFVLVAADRCATWFNHIAVVIHLGMPR